MSKVERALISLTDKSGIEGFAKELADLGIEILSTGGTAAKIREAGIDVMDVSEFTGFPEMLDGRVKTLHPKVHGGILNQRENSDHQKQCAEHGLKNIDLIAVNLYAFEKTIADPNCSLAVAIENIDIGGPTMLRASAKNFNDVTVIVDPNQGNNILSLTLNGTGLDACGPEWPIALLPLFLVPTITGQLLFLITLTLKTLF